MCKRLVAVVGVLTLVFGSALGDEVKGKIKKIDQGNNTLTLTGSD